MTTQNFVQKALEQAVYPFREKRTFICELQADVVGEGVSVSGVAMDPPMLDAVLQDMRSQLEGIAVEAGDVRYMRAASPTLLTQSTNLTGLYAEASFHSELVSQNLMGAQLEVLYEEGRWVYARQEDGYLGWAYKPYYAVGTLPPATHLVSKPVAHLHRQPQEDSPLVSLLLAGTYLRPGKTAGDWTLLDEPGRLDGYIARQAVRALADLPQDDNGRRSQMIEAGLQFIGTPYVWGGCSALGIDCSGLAQLLHRLVGITTPRDADMQRTAGRKVEPPYQPGDLVFFSDEPETRAITHVGVSMGGWVVLHSSRSRNGVYIDDIQAVPHLKEMFVDGCTYLGG